MRAWQRLHGHAGGFSCVSAATTAAGFVPNAARPEWTSETVTAQRGWMRVAARFRAESAATSSAGSHAGSEGAVSASARAGADGCVRVLGSADDGHGVCGLSCRASSGIAPAAAGERRAREVESRPAPCGDDGPCPGRDVSQGIHPISGACTGGAKRNPCESEAFGCVPERRSIYRGCGPLDPPSCGVHVSPQLRTLVVGGNLRWRRT